MIDLSIDKATLEKNIKKAREKGIIVPTFSQMRNPQNIPSSVKERLAKTGLWDVDPVNLFRITWKNEPKESGGLFGKPNYIELPSKLTGVAAKIICFAGKYFPTGCHKVGASFGCLAPRLVTGQFDATAQKAVWPSTGNYCRGGAFNSKLLAVDSVAILPEGMSRERFDWLKTVASQIIATPGTESNVKEIFDKVHELKTSGKNLMIFNQFEEMGNYLWHYSVTGPAIAEIFQTITESYNHKLNFAGMCLTSGSAGTLASGDFLKQQFPLSRLAVGEALQCPTILNNGFGAHRIEGIGDKHIPWVHNVKNTDMAIAVDDNDSMALLRLFNENAGKEYLVKEIGLAKEDVDRLSLMGISGIANMLLCVKFAKYYELGENDVIATVLTDSAEMYLSRIAELQEKEGAYTILKAAGDFAARLKHMRTDNMLELGYRERKQVHNLKYYTWVEQQGRTAEELNDLWYAQEKNFTGVQKQADEIDALINEFNLKTGLLR
ncbi:MAG: pyridoxal-5-phosphate-dependent protein subunit beta [Treponema sp.]|jgi:cysteine synthase|nr:pyridoxal-5-phosphate-dependent protein subunit beta [Treponema sp.]